MVIFRISWFFCSSGTLNSRLLLQSWLDSALLVMVFLKGRCCCCFILDLTRPFPSWGLLDYSHWIQLLEVFTFIKTSFTLAEPVSLVKVFRLFRLEWDFFFGVFRLLKGREPAKTSRFFYFILFYFYFFHVLGTRGCLWKNK
jgi:hypothetical protein